MRRDLMNSPVSKLQSWFMMGMPVFSFDIGTALSFGLWNVSRFSMFASRKLLAFVL